MLQTPNKSSSKYKQGFFRPRNLSKYKGDYNNIVYRSSWELKFLLWCDRDSRVLSYSSEETIIPYRHAVDGYEKLHRYFVDFKMSYQSADGSVSTYLVEIKPEIQTKKPMQGNKRKTTFINECKTYEVNCAKWEAATKFASDRGWKFIILTEKHLDIK